MVSLHLDLGGSAVGVSSLFGDGFAVRFDFVAHHDFAAVVPNLSWIFVL